MIPDRASHWRFIAACLTAGAAWIVVEVGGGLAFLAAGMRLWRYDIAPLFWEITSPVVWVFAVTLIVPLSIAYDRRVCRRLLGWRRASTRLVFLMVTGPVIEVLINEHIFKTWYGQPLYYATLMIHVPITERLLTPPSPALSPQGRST